MAVYRGQKLTLSVHEWKSLRRLTGTVGSVVPREELRTLLWGDDALMHDGEIDRCMEQLNKKLAGEGPAAGHINMVSGGFRLIVSPSEKPEVVQAR